MKSWRRLRAEADLSGRFLPLRIYILVIESALSLGLLAFTAPGLLTHYAGIVDGYPMLSKFGILMPEFVALALVVISIFCGYAKTSKVSFRFHVALVIILVAHGALIYGVAFMEKRTDIQVKTEIERRKDIADARSDNDLKIARGRAGIEDARMQSQADDIRREAQRRAMNLSVRGNLGAASRVLNAAESRIAKIYESKGVATVPDSSTGLNLDVSRLREEIGSNWIDRNLEKIRKPIALYLSTPVGFILPIICAFFFIVSTMKRWKEEGGHEMAAAGGIRQPSASKAYEVAGTGSLPGWKPTRPTMRLPEDRDQGK